MDLVVNTLVAKAIYKKEITIFGGEQYRPLLHVKDVARAVELAIRSKKKGIYNLHNKNLIIYQIAEKIKKTFKKLKINKISMKFEDLRNYRVSSKKAIKELKFKPKYDLRYGIEEMKNLLNQNRIKDIDNPKYINQAYLKKFNKES
jgi:nucleoside-diphosphate-sugar epimerase